MTEEQREHLVEKMARAIHATEWGADRYDFSHNPPFIQNEYRTEARAALAVADEAISKHYRARIAELEATLKEFADLLETWFDDLYARGSVPRGYRDIYEKTLRQLLNGEKG
jgi:hypothetical protein